MARVLFVFPFDFSGGKVMNGSKFFRAILDALEGRTEELSAIPPERLDWAGPGAMLDLYRQTSGNQREALIRAIGEVIEDHPTSPAVIAQLINIAAGLDLAQVEPQVRSLQPQPFASQEPLRSAIANYLAFRRLNITPDNAAPLAANGKPKVGKTKSVTFPKSAKKRLLTPQ